MIGVGIYRVSVFVRGDRRLRLFMLIIDRFVYLLVLLLVY